MKGILIDAFNRTIEEIQVAQETRAGLADLHRIIDCTRVEHIGIDEHNGCWVDEDGLLKAGLPRFNFMGRGLVGRMVILLDLLFK
jgi:hypothetical protein